MSGSNSLVDELKALEVQALEDVRAADSESALEEARITWLGRKEGRISLVLRKLGSIDPGERPAVGAEANRV